MQDDAKVHDTVDLPRTSIDDSGAVAANHMGTAAIIAVLAVIEEQISTRGRRQAQTEFENTGGEGAPSAVVSRNHGQKRGLAVPLAALLPIKSPINVKVFRDGLALRRRPRRSTGPHRSHPRSTRPPRTMPGRRAAASTAAPDSAATAGAPATTRGRAGMRTSLRALLRKLP
jgi:hypothetical protein